MVNIQDEIKFVSKKFSNGVTVVNATTSPIRFLSPEGDIVIVPCSVPDESGIGPVVITTKPIERKISDFMFDIIYEQTIEGKNIIKTIQEYYKDTTNVVIIGSLEAKFAYSKDVCNLVPATGFEYAISCKQLMSTEKFNIN